MGAPILKNRVLIPRRGRWSQEEINRLRETYGLRDLATIAREMRRPVPSVQRMARQVFAGQPRSGPWTAPEIQRLREYLGKSAPEVIAQVLGRTLSEVNERITELGRIQKSGRWTRQEVADLKRMYGTRTDEDLARVFGRSEDSLRRMAVQLALAKDKAFVRKLAGENTTKMPRWANAELETLREMYPKCANLDIAKALNRTVKSVVSKAHNLGLKKDEERLQEMGRANVMLRYKS